MCKGLISVIVPVYNTECFLYRCIDSILLQSYTNFELILINDGSTDSSPQICDEYALLDKRIKVFHIKNRGVSVARNIGLSNAQGEYITFIDSDDYIEPNCLELMHERMCENDVEIVAVNWKDQNGECFFEKYLVDNINEEGQKNNYKIYSKEEIPDLMFMYTVWGHLFRRDKLIENQFDETLFYSEDTVFTVKNLFLGEEYRILVMAEVLYTSVRDREDSAVNLPFNERMLTKISAYNQILEYVKPYNNLWNNIKLSKRMHCFHMYLKLKETNKFDKKHQYCIMLKKEISMLRKEGFAPIDKKESMIEFLYLHCYILMQIYSKFKG